MTYTMADAVKDVLCARALSADVSVDDAWAWKVDCGNFDLLHDAWDLYVERHGRTPCRPPETRYAGWQRHRILRSLARSERAAELFEKVELLRRYPGIVNGWSYVYTLRPEFRVMPAGEAPQVQGPGPAKATEPTAGRPVAPESEWETEVLPVVVLSGGPDEELGRTEDGFPAVLWDPAFPPTSARGGARDEMAADVQEETDGDDEEGGSHAEDS